MTKMGRRVLVVTGIVILAGCVPPPATVTPTASQLRFTARGTRERAVLALNGAALEMGFSVADANPAAGFWRTARLHVPNTGFAGMFVGSSGLDLDMSAVLADASTDSVLVILTGSTGFTEAENRYARDRDPITRRAARAWAYLDSLAAKTRRRL